MRVLQGIRNMTHPKVNPGNGAQAVKDGPVTSEMAHT
jgi:hypothetical protein